MSDGELSYLRFILSMCMAHLSAKDGESVVKLMKRYIKEQERGNEND